MIAKFLSSLCIWNKSVENLTWNIIICPVFNRVACFVVGVAMALKTKPLLSSFMLCDCMLIVTFRLGTFWKGLMVDLLQFQIFDFYFRTRSNPRIILPGLTPQTLTSSELSWFLMTRNRFRQFPFSPGRFKSTKFNWTFWPLGAVTDHIHWTCLFA